MNLPIGDLNSISNREFPRWKPLYILRTGTGSLAHETHTQSSPDSPSPTLMRSRDVTLDSHNALRPHSCTGTSQDPKPQGSTQGSSQQWQQTPMLEPQNLKAQATTLAESETRHWGKGKLACQAILILC